MSQSLNNSFTGTIVAGGNFTGTKEVINGSISIICALYTTVDLLIETYQSADNINYYSFSSFLHDVAIYGTHTRTQFYIEGRFGYIKVSNNTAGNATGVLFSTLYSANNHDGTLQQPTYIQGNVNISSIVPISGSVDITARSGTGFLSYLTDNVAVATMPAITGTVVVSSQPPLSYLTDNVAVATMPAITGTVVVSSQPPLSYLTDNVAVATMPAITGTVVVSSQPPLSYLTDNVAVATMPALTFSNDKVDITGSSVVVSSTPYLDKSTSSIKTYENPSFIISFDSGSTVRNIKTSAGSLQSLSLVNDNNNLAFVALYNDLAINVTVGTTVPIAVIVIQKNQAIQLVTHNLAFSTAISFFTATLYNGLIPLTNVYLTASYDN